MQKYSIPRNQIERGYSNRVIIDVYLASDVDARVKELEEEVTRLRALIPSGEKPL